MRRVTVVMSFVLLAVVFVAHIRAAPPVKTREEYWIGIDKVDRDSDVTVSSTPGMVPW